MANSVDPNQTAPIGAVCGAVCSGSTLFASILNSSVILGNYLQQTTFADAFFGRFKQIKQNVSRHDLQLDVLCKAMVFVSIVLLDNLAYSVLQASCCFRYVTWSVRQHIKLQQQSYSAAAKNDIPTDTQTDTQPVLHLSDSCIQVTVSYSYCVDLEG